MFHGRDRRSGARGQTVEFGRGIWDADFAGPLYGGLLMRC